MTGRTTLVWVAIAAVLLGYVYFFERPKLGEAERAEAETNRVWSLGFDAVHALQVPLERGGNARVVRDDASRTGWMLEEPLIYPADRSVIDGLIASLQTIDFQGAFDASELDPASFGLGSEREVIRVWEGEGTRELYLGGRTPAGTEVYASLSEDPSRVMMLEDWKASGIKPRLERLRDRQFFFLDPNDVVELEVWIGDERVIAATHDPDSDWQITYPEALPADQERLTRLAQDFYLARASQFVDEPTALASYGLDHPVAKLIFSTANESTTLVLGSGVGHTFVRVGEQKLLFETQERLLKNLPTDAFAFRFKDVIKLDPDRITRLRLEYPREKLRFSFELDEGQWVPEEDDMPIDALRIEDLRYIVEDLDASALETEKDLDALGLAEPSAKLIAYDKDDQELAWLALGDERDGSIAARSSQSDQLWRVPSVVSDDMPLNAADFRREFAVTDEPVDE